MEDKQYSPEQGEEIDLRQYLEVVLKWKWMILLITLGCILTSFILSAFIMTPIYETKTVLMVTQPANSQKVYQQNGDSLESTVDSMSRLPELTLNMFSSQFKNAEILGNVISKLKLSPQDYSVQSLGKAITVTPNVDNNLLEISVQDQDPVLVKKIANTMVDEFYAFTSASNQKQLKESVTLLKVKLQDTENELKVAAESYQQDQAQARNGELLQKELLSKSDLLTLSKAQLMEGKVELQQLMAAQKKLAQNLQTTPAKLVMKKTYLGDGQSSTILPDGSQTANGEYISEEANPLYLELIKNLNETDSQIAKSGAKISGLAMNIAQLEADVAGLQQEYSQKSMEENTLKRKLDSLENAYTVLNGKIIETEIAKSADFGRINLTLVSPAFDPTSPVKPNVPLNMAIAALLGMMAAVFLAFVLEFFDDTVKTAEDLKKLLNLPVLGTIPGAKQ